MKIIIRKIAGIVLSIAASIHLANKFIFAVFCDIFQKMFLLMLYFICMVINPFVIPKSVFSLFIF